MRRFHAKAFSAVFCLLALALLASSCTPEKEKAREEGKAPNFTLSDLHGTKVSLSGLRGKVVLIEFWATWCPPCRESIPELNRLYDKYRDKGVTVVGISVDKGGDVSSTVGSFTKEQGVLYPVLIDDGKVNTLYGVTSIPAMFIVDKEGRIVKKVVGFIPGLAENLSSEIEALL